jgi:hypothetical protein
MAQPIGEWDGIIRLRPGPHSSVVGYAKAGMAKTNNAPIAISPSIVLGATTTLDIIISTPVPSTYRVASHGDLNLILGADGSLSFGPVTLPPSSFPFDGLPHAITISLSATSISMQVDDGASYSAPYTPTSAPHPLYIGGGRNHEAPWAIGLSVHDIMVSDSGGTLLHYAFDSSDPLGVAWDSSPNALHGTCQDVIREGRTNLRSIASPIASHTSRIGSGLRMAVNVLRMACSAFRIGSGARTTPITITRPIRTVSGRIGMGMRNAAITACTLIWDKISDTYVRVCVTGPTRISPLRSRAIRTGSGLRMAMNGLRMSSSVFRIGSGTRTPITITRSIKAVSGRIGRGVRNVAITACTLIWDKVNDTYVRVCVTGPTRISPFRSWAIREGSGLRAVVNGLRMASSAFRIGSGARFPITITRPIRAVSSRIGRGVRKSTSTVAPIHSIASRVVSGLRTVVSVLRKVCSAITTPFHLHWERTNLKGEFTTVCYLKGTFKE